MGLKEKRLMAVIEEENIPYHVENYRQVTDGGELAFEVDWDQWADDHQGLLNLNGYQLQQFTDALHIVAADAMGKQALRDGLRTVKVVRVEDPADSEVALSDGVLEIKTAPAAGWDGVTRGREIADHLLDTL